MEVLEVKNTGPLSTFKGITRDEILNFQESVEESLGEEFLITRKQSDEWLTHTINDGVYVREFDMPAGTVVVGKIHKYAHINILAAGEVTVASEFHTERFQAPRVWVSEAGIKRVVYNHTDVKWITIHAVDPGETDVVKIENDVVVETYKEYDTFVGKSKLLESVRRAS